MNSTELYFFETGPIQRLPGFAEGCQLALLPFWGNYCLVDFMLAGFAGREDTKITILLDESSRALALALGSRWKKPIAKVHMMERGLDELLQMLSASTADRVILASLSAVCALEVQPVIDLAGRPDVAKISVSRTPIDMYCAQRDVMVKLIASAVARVPEQKRGQGSERLFSEYLHTAIDLIAEVPGELLFQNDLMEYYQRNIWAVAHCQDEQYNRIITRLPELADSGKESHIAEKAYIRDSLLASGVEVEGAVEGSIIFPNVLVRKNALVSNSVVLSGNRIGTGTEIRSTLVLPYVSDMPRTMPNIGDRCVLGAKGSTAKNSDYPEQIRDGITVIGMNAEIPNGFKAEAASLVGPGVPASLLKKMKILKRSASIQAPRMKTEDGDDDGSEGSFERNSGDKK